MWEIKSSSWQRKLAGNPSGEHGLSQTGQASVCSTWSSEDSICVLMGVLYPETTNDKFIGLSLSLVTKTEVFFSFFYVIG